MHESWFGGESLAGLDDARAAAERRCDEVAGERLHGTTREVPCDVFAERETPAMRGAPASHKLLGTAGAALLKVPRVFFRCSLLGRVGAPPNSRVFARLSTRSVL